MTRWVRWVLVRAADAVDVHVFRHRYHRGFCCVLADHPWWDEE